MYPRRTDEGEPFLPACHMWLACDEWGAVSGNCIVDSCNRLLTKDMSTRDRAEGDLLPHPPDAPTEAPRGAGDGGPSTGLRGATPRNVSPGVRLRPPSTRLRSRSRGARAAAHARQHRAHGRRMPSRGFAQKPPAWPRRPHTAKFGAGSWATSGRPPTQPMPPPAAYRAPMRARSPRSPSRPRCAPRRAPHLETSRARGTHGGGGTRPTRAPMPATQASEWAPAHHRRHTCVPERWLRTRHLAPSPPNRRRIEGARRAQATQGVDGKPEPKYLRTHTHNILPGLAL